MPAAEEGAQQNQLRMAGVLVLIQQHHLVPAALGGAHLAMARRDPRRELNLVAMVEHLARLLGLDITGDKRKQLLTSSLCLDYPPGSRRDLARQRGKLGGQPLAHGEHVTRCLQVLGEVAGELQHRRGHGLRRPLHLIHRPVVRGHDRGGELPGQGGLDEPHRRLESLPERVIADQTAGVGVIGTDRRLELGLGLSRRGPGEACPAQRVETHPDPLGELGRRLPRERQPEHPVRADQSVGDQPHQPRRHRLALARARPGDDRERPERRADHRRLLCRRLRNPQHPRQLPRRVRRHILIPHPRVVPPCTSMDRVVEDP